MILEKTLNDENIINGLKRFLKNSELFHFICKSYLQISAEHLKNSL